MSEALHDRDLSAVESKLGSMQPFTPEDEISATALSADGTTHALNNLKPTDTILTAKQQLATMTDMLVSAQSLFLLEDTREGVDDLELPNDALISVVKSYAMTTATNLQFAVMIGLKNDNAAEFVKALTPATFHSSSNHLPKPSPEDHFVVLGNGECGNTDETLNRPRGITFVPAYPELLIVAACGSHQVRVYHIDSGELLLSLGDKDGQHGDGECEFFEPWSVEITPDSQYVVVAEDENNRLQVLRLDVTRVPKLTVQLNFVRFIGIHMLRNPRGLALRRRYKYTTNEMNSSLVPLTYRLCHRSVGTREDVLTVVVADNGHGQLAEFELETGAAVGTIGEQGCAEGQLAWPNGVAILSTGEMAVADGNNGR
jgi:DNA-binding beta-propeller fold protein YncE